MIELKRDAQPMKVLNNLFKHTALQQSFGVNMLALVEDGTQPRVLTLKRALQEYIGHRQDVIRRRTEYELERGQAPRPHPRRPQDRARPHRRGYRHSSVHRSTPRRARNNLMTQFKSQRSPGQCHSGYAPGRLAALERKKIEDEYKEVIKRIARLEALLADPQKILGVIKDMKRAQGEIRRRAPHAHSGRSRPILSDEDLIPEVDVLVTSPTADTSSASPTTSIAPSIAAARASPASPCARRTAFSTSSPANTMDSLLVFTNSGKVYQVKVHELPDAGRTAKGLPIVNIVNMQPDETVTTLLKVKDFGDGGYLFFTTRQGTVKRVELRQFQSVRSNGMIAITLDDGDELAWVRMSSGEDNVILVTQKGQAIRFHESDVRPMGRPAAGVRGIRLAAGDRVIASEMVNGELDLLVVSAKGMGKRTANEQFKTQGRAARA